MAAWGNLWLASGQRITHRRRQCVAYMVHGVCVYVCVRVHASMWRWTRRLCCHRPVVVGELQDWFSLLDIPLLLCFGLA